MIKLKLIATSVFLLWCISVSAQTDPAQWLRSKEYTREYLEAMPAESYSLKPSPEMRSFAEQMLHLAEANYAFISAVTQTTNPAKALEKTSAKSKDAVIKATLDSYDFVINQLKGLSIAQYNDLIKLYGQFDVTKAQAVDKAFEHQVHHRGQTTVYLRLAKVKPPEEKLF